MQKEDGFKKVFPDNNNGSTERLKGRSMGDFYNSQ